MWYFLKNKKVVSSYNEEDWLEWNDIYDPIVAQHTLFDYSISTVFLGIDYKCDPKNGDCLFFETVVFKRNGRIHNTNPAIEVCHYKTWEEAESGHLNLVKIYMTSNT